MDQNQNLNVDFSKTTPIKCEKCQSEFFEEILILRKISKLLVGASKDVVYPIRAIRCADCKSVKEDMLPK